MLYKALKRCPIDLRTYLQPVEYNFMRVSSVKMKSFHNLTFIAKYDTQKESRLRTWLALARVSLKQFFHAIQNCLWHVEQSFLTLLEYFFFRVLLWLLGTGFSYFLGITSLYLFCFLYVIYYTTLNKSFSNVLDSSPRNLK